MTTTRIRRAIIALLIAACALIGLPASSASAAPKQVLVIGDSITGGASNYINFYLAGSGDAQTTFRTVGGLALCDMLPGSGGPWTINSLLAAKRYDAVIVAFSGNASTSCMGGRTGQAVIDVYKADAATFMGITAQYGVPIVNWVRPPAAASPALDYVRTGLGGVYGALPATYPTARSIDGGTGLETPDGRFAYSLPCAPWDTGAGSGCVNGQIRIGADDGVHLYCARRGPAYYGVVPPCDTYSAGSNRYGMNLGATRAMIGLT